MDFVEKSVDNFEIVKEKISNHTVWCTLGVGRSHFRVMAAALYRHSKECPTGVGRSHFRVTAAAL